MKCFVFVTLVACVVAQYGSYSPSPSHSLPDILPDDIWAIIGGAPSPSDIYGDTQSQGLSVIISVPQSKLDVEVVIVSEQNTCEDVLDETCPMIGGFDGCGFCVLSEYPSIGYGCTYNNETEIESDCECVGTFITHNTSCPTCNELLNKLVNCAGIEIQNTQSQVHIPSTCLEDTNTTYEDLVACKFVVSPPSPQVMVTVPASGKKAVAPVVVSKKFVEPLHVSSRPMHSPLLAPSPSPKPASPRWEISPIISVPSLASVYSVAIANASVDENGNVNTYTGTQASAYGPGSSAYAISDAYASDSNGNVADSDSVALAAVANTNSPPLVVSYTGTSSNTQGDATAQSASGAVAVEPSPALATYSASYSGSTGTPTPTSVGQTQGDASGGSVVGTTSSTNVQVSAYTANADAASISYAG